MTPEEFREKRGIDARVLHEVMEVDLKARRVLVRKIDDSREFHEAFDHLLIATGAVPIVPNVPGADTGGIYHLSSLETGLAVRKAVDEQKPQTAVIVGGGYIGLEMAEALVMRGLKVSLVERADQVMGTLDPDMGELVSQVLIKIGVSLCRGEALTGFEVDEPGNVGIRRDNERNLSFE